jgi:hypothetical protein
MTYAVIWAMDAIRELTRIEQAAVDPAAVRAAANRIDFALRRVPRDMGESRDGDERLWYEDVLGVWYRVDDVQMRVQVGAVGLSRRH